MRKNMLLILLLCGCLKFNPNKQFSNGIYFDCNENALLLEYPTLFAITHVEAKYLISSGNDTFKDEDMAICNLNNSLFIPNFHKDEIVLRYLDTCDSKCSKAKSIIVFKYFSTDYELLWDSLSITNEFPDNTMKRRTFVNTDTLFKDIPSRYNLLLDSEIKVLFSGNIDHLIQSITSNPAGTFNLYLKNGRILSKELDFIPAYLTRLESIQFKNFDYQLE